VPYIHRTGDIFTTELPAIGHGVNLQGLMGSGIAYIIAKKFPSVLAPYRQACKSRILQTGRVFPVLTEEQPGLWIYNLASQDQTGADARIDWLEESVRASIVAARRLNHSGIALPRIGAGIGGLTWNEVKTLLETIGDEQDDFLIEIWSLADADD